MKRERTGIKAANGVGPGAKLSVRQTVMARLMKKARGNKKDGRKSK